MDFTRDDASPENPKGTLCMSSSTYVEKMIATYEFMFGEKPKHYRSECDSSELIEKEGIQRYQFLIGSMQWSLTTAVMTMSGFRVAPRKERAKRIYRYLANMKHASILIRTGEPDYSGLPTQDFDWAMSAYGNVKEIIPDNAPEPL
jgi:hypothetical protein